MKGDVRGCASRAADASVQWGNLSTYAKSKEWRDDWSKYGWRWYEKIHWCKRLKLKHIARYTTSKEGLTEDKSHR